ncbi:MAG: hypothetical protein U1F47_02285 [Hyphomicrobiales bacterium]
MMMDIITPAVPATRDAIGDHIRQAVVAPSAGIPGEAFDQRFRNGAGNGVAAGDVGKGAIGDVRLGMATIDVVEPRVKVAHRGVAVPGLVHRIVRHAAEGIERACRSRTLSGSSSEAMKKVFDPSRSISA